jgi:hypothetical protein
MHIFLYCLGNNVPGRVYCPRALSGVSAVRWSSDVLPHLGPEIIAAMQVACSFAPNDSRSSPRLILGKSDERIIPAMVLSSTLRYSNSGTVGVLNLWVHWRP